MTPFRQTLIAAAIAAAATAGHAQTPGLYVGQTSQGNPIEITIGDDGFGNPLFTNISVPFNVICNEGNPKTMWWGIGTAVPIFQYPFTWEFHSDIVYEALKMKFNNGTFSGSIVGTEPAFVDVFSSRNRVTRCTSNPQTFTATLTTPAAAAQRRTPQLAPGQMLKMGH